MSIKWILEAFASLQQTTGRNLMIVPVMVSYDRILEGLNMATEMIQGEKTDYDFTRAIFAVNGQQKNQLGHVYVKYLNPINLAEYTQSFNKGGDESAGVKKLQFPQNIELVSKALTTYVMKCQQKATPVTLNSLLSSVILQEKNPSMQLSDLIDKSSMVYDYLKEKPLLATYMTVKPMKALVQMHIAGLGFGLNEVTKKDARILLNKKEEDLRCKLILAHYSMQLMPAFLIEGCLSIFLMNEVLTEEYFEGKPVAMRPLFDIVQLYADLFKNEHFTNYDLSKENLLEKVDHFVKKGYLKVEDNNVSIANKKRAFTLLEFFGNLIHPLIDTYLITLTAIAEMCGKNLVLKNKKLIKEIHVCIKRLHQLKVIPYLHSCLKEIITTALDRFEQIGFISVKGYATKKGSTTLFLQCPAESKPAIDELQQKIRSHRKITREQQNIVFNQVEETILRVQGPLLISARL